MRNKILLGLGFLTLVGCNSSDYLYYNNPKNTQVSLSQKITEIGASHVDIIWQVGGMTELQTTLEAGASRFATQLSSNMNVDWKIGVISNQPSDAPFLGFDTPFDSRSPTPVSTFVDAVHQIVSDESHDGEKTMEPIFKILTNYPAFLRQSSYLVMIVTNDNHDQSAINVADFLNFIKGLKGDLSHVLIYAVLGTTDFGCNQGTIDEDWNYKGSTFEQIVQATHGQAYSLCTSDFGTSLAKIGDDLVSRVGHPKISLASRPIVNSIQVTFHGQVLPGGPQISGGVWYYDFDLNAVVFYDVNFAINASTDESVQVTFTPDAGHSL